MTQVLQGVPLEHPSGGLIIRRSGVRVPTPVLPELARTGASFPRLSQSLVRGQTVGDDSPVIGAHGVTDVARLLACKMV